MITLKEQMRFENQFGKSVMSNTPGEPKNRQKAHIVKACSYLFGKRGVHSVTMDDVARHLGVSKKTLYTLYESKEVMVTDVVNKLIEESRAELTSVMAQGQTFTIRLLTFNRLITDQALSLGSNVLYDIQKYYPFAHQLIKDYKYEMIRLLRDLLIEGQRSGVVRSTIDPLVSAELRINFLEWDILEADYDTMPMKVKQNKFFDLMLHGLKAPGSRSFQQDA